MKAAILRSLLCTVAGITLAALAPAKAKLVETVQITDSGLYFDGERVTGKERMTREDRPRYDFAFGRRITPHGDCIDRYGDFVFMTWYKGPEADRTLMLSRYNLKSKKLVTLQFEHRHTGFKNRPHIGESHNTIAVGISPIDGTIHLVYDLHGYGKTYPKDGSLADDYFRYQYTSPHAAAVPDEEFTVDLFKPKQLSMNATQSYEGLTYPYFHTNDKGELFLRFRRGGSNDGQLVLSVYADGKWSDFWEFNVRHASQHGYTKDWGLYGDLKFENGKLRAGFHTRYKDYKDRFKYNNGFHYAYSNDPKGRGQWFTHDHQPITLPIANPDPLRFYEPGDVFDEQAKDSIRISSGTEWTVTADDSLHFVTQVTNDKTGETIHVHAFKKASDADFTTATDFPGGQLFSIDKTVYLIGLDDGRPYVLTAPGGTDDWQPLYRAADGPQFHHGSVHISHGMLYYYLMERGKGSAQPVQLQIIDLGLNQDQN